MKELELASPDNSFKKFCSKLKRNGGVTEGISGVCFSLKLRKIRACLYDFENDLLEMKKSHRKGAKALFLRG